jgi:hypothetical protein
MNAGQIAGEFLALFVKHLPIFGTILALVISCFVEAESSGVFALPHALRRFLLSK